VSDPSVSVIIPAYNAAGTVRDAAASVQAQTYDDWEMILVDDGSSDDTWAVLREIADACPQAGALHMEHAGLAAARNRAIAGARGEWIALLDADDAWKPEKLQRCMDYLVTHPELKVVYTPMETVDETGRPMKGHAKPCHAGWLAERLFQSIFIHDPSAVFHRDVIETVGGFDESLPVCVGHEFWLRVATRFEIGLIGEPLAVRGWSERSLTRGNRVRARMTKSHVMDRFYYERGGRELLSDRRKARRRLARVHYATGKILLKERRLREAGPYLRKAVGLYPWLMKAWPLLAIALTGRAIGFKSRI
jgi:glycosyltransferase involved in cell wall biosynthesis